MNHILLDTETTDVGWGSRLVQLAYKVIETGEEVNEFFKPPVDISFSAMAVHHITNEMVADKPPFEGSPAKEKIQSLLNDGILIAHAAPYDMGILYQEGVTTPQHIDTLRVAKHVLGSPKNNLQYLRYALDLQIEAVAHDAYGDILVLEGLYNHLTQVLKEQFSLNSDEEVTNKFIDLTNTPVLLTTIRFGKHKGKTFEEVSIQDRGYLEWLLGSEQQKKESEQNEELVYTLKHYLP